VKITLDTNILVRGHQNASGPSRSLLDLIIGSEHVLVLSQNILYELEEVLRYPQIKRLTRLTEGQIAEYVGFLSEAAELVDIGPPIPFPTPDADDWTVLRTAIHGDVDVLCSLDGHFRRDDLASVYEHYHFNVMTDVELLRLLRSGA
jgi:uncharacterized protein